MSGNTRRNAALVGLVGLGVIGYLAFAVFGVHTLFIDEEVDEAQPSFVSGVTVPDDTDKPEPSSDSDSDQVSNELSELPELDGSQEAGVDGESPGAVVEVASGDFIDRAHTSVGEAAVLNDGSSQRFLRFENFETDNGPDLFVYLTTADAAADEGEFGKDGQFVDLGSLKGNIGDQNYEIPVSVDLAEFDTVVIWCRRFGVAFGAADLTML